MAGRPKRRAKRQAEKAAALRQEYLRQAVSDVLKKGKVKEKHLRQLSQADINGKT